MYNIRRLLSDHNHKFEPIIKTKIAKIYMNNNDLSNDCQYEDESFSFEDFQSNLESQIEEHLSDLSDFEMDFEKIGDSNALVDTIATVVWEQFINQIGVVAGKEFIKENKGLNLDLRNSAHIQTSDNFEKGKIATHNNEIKYQKRYDDWQSKFVKDQSGNVVMHNTRYGREKENLKNYRKPFENGRPTGSNANATHMDHIISAAEIVRNPKINAHLDLDEQIKFANSPSNLNEMNASQNQSKSDSPMTEWLDNSNKKGYKPNEIFDIPKELDQEYRDKDRFAREELDKTIKKGEEKSISSGKKSQKQEAFRIGGKALQAVLMGLLAGLVKKIIQKLIQWMASGKKNFKSFLDNLKVAVSEFIGDLKVYLVNAADTLLTSIATAIFGSVINMLKKTGIFLKQGYQSVKQAVEYIKDPQNKGKSLSILMLEVGKIVTVGLTAGGAILLGNSLEATLSTIPGLGFPIPLIGSLASILGVFFGAITSGIIGALALNLIDRMIATKKKSLLTEAKIDKGQEIAKAQNTLMYIVKENTSQSKNQFAQNVNTRHSELEDRFISLSNNSYTEIDETKNDNDIDELFNLLNS